MNEGMKRPLIVRFAELARPAGRRRRVLYSEIDGINYIETPDGVLKPAVESAAAGTVTRTDVRSEGTDTDPGDDASRCLARGTSTLSEARGEATDTDPSDDHALNSTSVDKEQLQQAIILNGRPYTPWIAVDVSLGTETQTRAKAENTDRD